MTTTTAKSGRRRRRPRPACALLAAAVAAFAHTAARAQQPPNGIGVYVTAATDARTRGLSQVAAGSAVRVGFDYQHASGFFAGGVLGNTVYETRAGYRFPHDRLAELYAGWLRRGTHWDFTASLGAYRYPDSTFDYDYEELSAAVRFRDRYFYRVAYLDGLPPVAYSAVTHELGAALPLRGGFELGASIGQLRSRGAGRLDYTYYDIGASKLVGRFGLDLRRYETSREIWDYLGSSEGDRWVLSLSYAVHPRP